jgi:hypothetical protein
MLLMYKNLDYWLMMACERAETKIKSKLNLKLVLKTILFG